jgi:hypothetical protein
MNKVRGYVLNVLDEDSLLSHKKICVLGHSLIDLFLCFFKSFSYDFLV